MGLLPTKYLLKKESKKNTYNHLQIPNTNEASNAFSRKRGG